MSEHVGATMEITLEKNWTIEVFRRVLIPKRAIKQDYWCKVVVLGLATSHVQKLKRFAGTSGWSVPISQSQTTVFVGQWMEWNSLPPPATNDNTSWEEVLHLFRCFTRTPGRNRANPERQEKEKSGHQRWANGRNSAEGGGEQTNPQNHPKPTYAEKRT